MNDTPKYRQKLLCTLGPASLNATVIRRLEKIGVSLFRINLSHTKLEDVEEVIATIQRFSDVPICLDSEGAQVRTGQIQNTAIRLVENNTIEIPFENVIGTSERLNLTPLDVAQTLRVNDVVSLDFNAALIRIISTSDKSLSARVISSGWVGSNKAASVDRPPRHGSYYQKGSSCIRNGYPCWNRELCPILCALR